MKRTLGIITAGVAALALSTPALAATYELDPSHSNISFKVRHLGLSNVPGTFDTFTGSFEFDPASNTATGATATIETASINTRDAKRDGHLKSPDFFDAEKYPQITFKSTGISRAKDGTYTLKGDLTMRGVTKPVTLTATLEGAAPDPWGNQRAAFSATGKVDRTLWGISWNKDLDKGGLLVGNEVTITIEAEGVEKKAVAN